MSDQERLALLGPCGLPSPGWAGDGCHKVTTHDTARLDVLEAALAGLDAWDYDTWASYGPTQQTAVERPSRR